MADYTTSQNANHEAESDTYNDRQWPPIYKNKNIIIKQPTFVHNPNRCPLPISIISNENRLNSCIIPFSGIQLLNDVDQINIEQTVELDELSSAIDSENRFIIKGQHGQILYSGLESSSAWQRMFCGSGRKFIFTIFDRSKQEAMFFTRRLACKTPPFGCFLQKLNVFLPPYDYIGSVEQVWTPMVLTLEIRNASHSVIFRLEGPRNCMFQNDKEARFTVYEGTTQIPVTTLFYQWDERIRNYNFTINFPPSLNYCYKALFIPCAILLVYMNFETSTKKCCSVCS